MQGYEEHIVVCRARGISSGEREDVGEKLFSPEEDHFCKVFNSRDRMRERKKGAANPTDKNHGCVFSANYIFHGETIAAIRAKLLSLTD